MPYRRKARITGTSFQQTSNKRLQLSLTSSPASSVLKNRVASKEFCSVDSKQWFEKESENGKASQRSNGRGSKAR